MLPPMQSILTYLRANALLVAGALVLLLALMGLASRNGNNGPEFLTVTRGAFVQEVSVSGRVIAAQDVDLGFSQGGRVAGRYVKVGDHVRAGATLAELENGDLRASVLQKQASLEREQASFSLIKEGTRSEEVEIAISEVQSDETTLSQRRNELVDAIKDSFSTADDAIRNTIDQFIDSPRTDPQLTFIVSDVQLETKVERARLEIETVLALWRKNVDGLASEAALPGAVAEAQNNLTRVALLLADANAALNKSIPTGSNTQSVIDGYESDVAAARSSINAAVSAQTSAITAEKNAASQLDTSHKNLALKEAGSRGSDIAAQEADVKAAEADLANARAQLAKTIMRAPFSGIVTKMDLKVGAVASANSSDASMISSGAFEIESFVPEVNIALIELNDPANVTLDAYGDEAVFTAHVVSIDPAETIRDGVSTYKTLLEFEKQDQRIRSGMTANVVITTDVREGIIGIPQGAVIERGGKKYVRVMEDNEILDREVTTGAISNLGNVEILSGLSEGERVVLTP